ncbi:DUF1315 family protein [Haliea sp. AH-315-K21]|uniref:DUF1315 domain-containing protein n=1 Tax=SAR86 cluster bacterium TaxID=2030880 RepID=A0A2A5C7X9_9GAMM|nr:DUF1315 family protein [Haliea sp. AH-315-K21]PCJ39984.1 MAG: hypothetical protein COA71_12480 [SAR86 cluster bacterium]
MDNTPENFEELLSSITPEVHTKLKQAIELGRWENGDRLSKEQVELCMQAVIAYDEVHLNEEEKIGYIDRTKLRVKSGAKPGSKVESKETRH